MSSICIHVCFSCKSAHGRVYNLLFDSVCVAYYANEREEAFGAPIIEMAFIGMRQIYS
jgi:hypothetical protein